MEVLIISRNKGLLINDEIREKEVRLISSGGDQLGIVPIEKALDVAHQENLDLVQVAPNATPPVCKVMDYGKYVYEQTRKEREARRNQHISELKEVRLSVKIEQHDFDTKVRHAHRFLKNGDKVKVTIRFRGREIAHPQIAEEIMKRFADDCSELGEVDSGPKMEGRSMTMFINPISE